MGVQSESNDAQNRSLVSVELKKPLAHVEHSEVRKTSLLLGNYHLGIMEHTVLCKEMFPNLAKKICKAFFYNRNILVGKRMIELKIKLTPPGKAELYELSSTVGVAVIFH